jgi:phosphopantothenoylcysteine decarboxylase/phosphopantothenate--cysteine ligase
MRILVTAGPTREYLDPVRFITNASSGYMGYCIAAAGATAGHQVTLASGPVNLDTPAGCRRVDFVSVDDLKRCLDENFPACDAIIMAAAVGDFRPDAPSAVKLHRGGGPITIRLSPVEDLLAGLGRRKMPGQLIVAFAVEDGNDEQIEAKARRKLIEKNADYIVVNTPEAMSAKASRAAILSRDGFVLPWAIRCKEELAGRLVSLL